MRFKFSADELIAMLEGATPIYHEGFVVYRVRVDQVKTTHDGFMTLAALPKVGKPPGARHVVGGDGHFDSNAWLGA